MSMGAFWFPSTHTLKPSTVHGKVQHPSTVCIRQNHPLIESKTQTDAEHQAPTVTPAFECRPWNVKQRDHVSSAQLNEMPSCTAAARADATDAASRMEQKKYKTTSTGAFGFTSTHVLQPSATVGTVQHPSTVCIRQDHPFVESKTQTDAEHQAPTVTPAFECRPWKVKQRDLVSSAQLNEMLSCTAAARADATDAASRMEHERGTTSTGAFWFPCTYSANLQPSTSHGKVQQPSTVCIRQDHPFVESNTPTDADHHRR